MHLRVLLSVTFLILSSVALSSSSAKPYIIGYDETKAQIANMTMLFYDRVHGTQVEYNGSNGKTYLLYPGNKVIVKGQWKLERTDNPSVFNMCFKYPANSYNPATNQSGGSWECQKAGFYLIGPIERAQGDVLGLAKGDAAPFILQKRKTSLKSLVRKLPKP